VGSAELTLPGYIHDVCSAVYPLAIGSPFFRCRSNDTGFIQWIHQPPAELERDNANLIGGDINGAADVSQLFLRPTLSLYKTPKPNLYLCSASTPPGGGVHGMCGYFAAQRVLKDHG
jgi:phytoene dehydrogenase-like protein